MNNNKKFGYVRVSATTQNIIRQIEAFIQNGINERDIFIDKKSGKDFEREQYKIMKSMLRENDILYIKSIDRLGRNYEMIVNEWKDITKNIKADIVVLDMPLLDTRQKKDLLGTFINDLILQILSYVAEQERTYIKTRQREGIDLALKTGKTKTGRPFGRHKIKKPDNFDEIVKEWRNKKITAREAMKLLDLKPNTFYNLVKNN